MVHYQLAKHCRSGCWAEDELTLPLSVSIGRPTEQWGRWSFWNNGTQCSQLEYVTQRSWQHGMCVACFVFVAFVNGRGCV